jgi:putative intracellular protease/amidase
MKKRLVLRASVGALALLAAAGVLWILSLPLPPPPAIAPPIAPDEMDATIASLKPPKRARPLIAIVGVNEGTEVTDYLMPYGILRRADIADVLALSTKPGPVALYPALKVQAQATIGEFDAKYPEGADYVIVPAMHRDDDPAALQWIRKQAASGAIIIGVCVGARVVAEAGLLDGKQATTHWYSVEGMLENHPGIHHVRNRRYIVDRGVMTTTGITASMPMSLTLIQAIAGRDKAEAVARGLGIAHWDARHDSSAFSFTRPFALTALGNRLAFWNHERLGMELQPQVDEVSLALVSDAWSRTFKSRAVMYAESAEPQRSRNGLLILPDEVATSWPSEAQIPAIGETQPAKALNDGLSAIEQRYGKRTADFVAMQLEYPR